MNNQIASKKFRHRLALLFVSILFLAFVLGCSWLRLPQGKSKRHPGWNIREACAYLNDVGIDRGLSITAYGCLGGGYVRNEDRLLHQEKRPGNLGSAIYNVRSKDDIAEEIVFSITSDPDVNNSNYRAFSDYSQKLFQKVFNKEMPDQIRNDIEKLGKPPCNTGTCKPFEHTVDNAKIELKAGYVYKITIKR
jgi:hypothetical protein